MTVLRNSLDSGKWSAIIAFLLFIFTSPVLGSSLSDHFGSAISGSTGTAPFSNADLSGYIEFAAFTETAFESFTSFDVPSGEVAYAYQIFNEGDDNISADTVLGLNGSVTGIGDTTIDGGESETPPTIANLILGSAEWQFTPAANNIQPGGRSDGLVLTSTNLPGPHTNFSIIEDGGTSANAMVVAPGDTPIPEPTSLVLLVIGVAAACVRRKRRR